MRKLLRLLLTRSYAAGALALLAVIVGLAALVPDADALEALGRRHPLAAWALGRLRPAEVAHSPVLWLIAGYVAVAIAASMVTRIRARRAGARAGPPPLQRFVVRKVVRLAAPPAEAERRVREAVRVAGFGPGEGLAGGTGAAGFWGSMAFHAGLLFALAGVVLSARLRFEGEFVLAEGFPMGLTPEAFVRASPPDAIRKLPPTRLVVSDVTASYERGTQLTDVSAVVTVEHPRVAPASHFVSVNVPLDVEGLELTVQSYGYAPELRVTDAAGRVRVDGNVVLRILPPGTEDAVLLGDGGVLKVQLYPDHVLDRGEDATRSLAALSPVLRFRWYEGERLVADGRVPRGGEARVGPYTVAFPDLVRWLRLYVVRDPGVLWFAIGGALGALGLGLRLLLYEQAWRARLEPAEGGTAVDVAVSCRYYPARLEQRAAQLFAVLEGSKNA